ncbi:MAG: Transcriptional regulator, LacI family, partial [uncultured Thermoleophilia bacterium]
GGPGGRGDLVGLPRAVRAPRRQRAHAGRRARGRRRPGVPPERPRAGAAQAADLVGRVRRLGHREPDLRRDRHRRGTAAAHGGLLAAPDELGGRPRARRRQRAPARAAAGRRPAPVAGPGGHAGDRRAAPDVGAAPRPARPGPARRRDGPHGDLRPPRRHGGGDAPPPRARPPRRGARRRRSDAARARAARRGGGHALEGRRTARRDRGPVRGRGGLPGRARRARPDAPSDGPDRGRQHADGRSAPRPARAWCAGRHRHLVHRLRQRADRGAPRPADRGRPARRPTARAVGGRAAAGHPRRRGGRRERRPPDRVPDAAELCSAATL